MSLKFVAGITLYNPDLNIVEHINGYLDSFDAVVVFDNSDKRNIEYNRIICQFRKDVRLIYIDGKGNMGLPYAYNRMMEDERIADFDYMCTLDQDSIFLHEDIVSMKNYIENQLPDFGERVAVIGPYIDYGNRRDDKHITKRHVEEKKWLITSGAFVNLHLYHNGGFSYDENYFIDKFEIDLCKQFTNAGYRVLMYHASVLHQRLGEDNGHSHPNHSSLRHYYLFRNRFYFNKKFYSIPKRWILNILQTARHVLLIALYEDDRILKVSELWKAAKHYRNKNFGKAV
mgnify:CR=1 FL=1